MEKKPQSFVGLTGSWYLLKHFTYAVMVMKVVL